MTKYIKTAKDKAFDKKIGKLNSRIRDLEFDLKKKENQISIYEKKIEELTIQLNNQNDMLNKLLEYTTLSKDEMTKIINKERISIELSQKMNTLFSMNGLFASDWMDRI